MLRGGYKKVWNKIVRTTKKLVKTSKRCLKAGEKKFRKSITASLVCTSK